MRFRELPRSLQIYILSQGVFLIPFLPVLAHSSRPANGSLLCALLLSSVLFATWRAELTVLQGKMTLVFAVVCLAVLLQGPQAAVACAVLGALVSTLVRPEANTWRVRLLRMPIYKYWFNMTGCAVSCAAASLLFAQVRELKLGPSHHVVGLTVFSTTYFLFNTVSVSVAIALQQRRRWAIVWKENFLWTAPGFFASASVAAGIQAVFGLLHVWSLLFLAPLYVVYYSYRLYMDRVRKDMEHIQELSQLNQAVILSLATAIDAKDRYTCSHINRVQQYATAVARAAGLEGRELQAVTTGALVHDIGKLGIPDHILGKPGKLTADEYKRMQSHVTIGAEILSPVPFPFPVVEVVLTHHERWDGLGYPKGLRGEEIPLGGRIIALVDVFDALTSNRPYRRALSHEEALQTLRDGAGKQFDPRLVRLFEQVLPEVHQRIQEMEAQALAAAAEQAAATEAPTALMQISQAAAEMAAVCDVAHTLAEETTEAQALRVVVNRALGLLPADTAVLYLRSPDGRELEAAAVEGKYRDRLEGMSMRVGEGVAGAVAASQQPVVKVSAAPDIARRFSAEENVELSAVTAVPLVHGPENLGVLAVYTQAYSVSSEHHLHVLNILAEHAAATIQNLRRLELNREMAYTDPLTGLANSRCLLRHLERLLHQPPTLGQEGTPPFAVVMLDLDRFKEVNDTLGHLRGDDLLRLVTDTLTTLSRPSDFVCRYAGDEFVLILAEASLEQAEDVARRVREAIDHLDPVDGLVKIGASVGIATFPCDGSDGRSLIQAADQRMYEDKFNRRSAEPRGRRAGGRSPALATA
jgi:diguanylate cyclase (GGDEF)-like protein/putative nucleotidyltransferase with HDIG domain